MLQLGVQKVPSGQEVCEMLPVGWVEDQRASPMISHRPPLSKKYHPFSNIPPVSLSLEEIMFWLNINLRK